MKNYLFFILFFSLLCFGSSAQTWEQLGDVPFAKHDCLAGVYDGKAYLFEGFNEGNNTPSNETWQYDPVSDSWTQLANVPFELFTSSLGTSVGNKFYLGFGLRSNNFDWHFNRDWHVYDYQSSTWEEMPEAPLGFAFGIMKHLNGKIYAGLGADEQGNGNSSWYSYDLSSSTWEQKASCPTNDIHQCFAYTLGNYIYVGGGHAEDSWYRYNPNDDTWETISNTLGARHVGSSAQDGNMGYAIGGDKDSHAASIDDDEYVMQYDPIADDWSFVVESPDGRRTWPITFVIDGTMYYCGGFEEENNYFHKKTMWKYDLNNLSTSTFDIDKTKDLVLYPNPTQDIITLLSLPPIINPEKAYSYQIIDLEGRILHGGELNQNKISTKILPSGQYILNVQSAETIYSATFIKI